MPFPAPKPKLWQSVGFHMGISVLLVIAAALILFSGLGLSTIQVTLCGGGLFLAAATSLVIRNLGLWKALRAVEADPCHHEKHLVLARRWFAKGDFQRGAVSLADYLGLAPDLDAGKEDFFVTLLFRHADSRKDVAMLAKLLPLVFTQIWRSESAAKLRVYAVGPPRRLACAGSLDLVGYCREHKSSLEAQIAGLQVFRQSVSELLPDHQQEAEYRRLDGQIGELTGQLDGITKLLAELERLR